MLLIGVVMGSKSDTEALKPTLEILTQLGIDYEVNVISAHRTPEKAKQYGMNALAISDHGNMFGVKEFYDQAKKNNIKPILGCEVYIARRSRFDKVDKIDGSENRLRKSRI